MFDRYFNAEPFEAVKVIIGIVVLLMGLTSGVAYAVGEVLSEVGIIIGGGLSFFGLGLISLATVNVRRLERGNYKMRNEMMWTKRSLLVLKLFYLLGGVLTCLFVGIPIQQFSTNSDNVLILSAIAFLGVAGSLPIFLFLGPYIKDVENNLKMDSGE